MKRASDRLSRIPPSATLGISARARELRAEGLDVVSFGAGEPDFATPEHVVAAAARACHDPENHKYSASAGLRPLREAIAADVGQYSGVEVDWSEVMVTNGAKQAVFQAFAALLDPGDEVLLPSPHWVTYPAGIDLAGGVTVPVPTRIEDEFKVDVESLERARTDRTRMLVFVSPSNPTGAVYTAEEARAIGEWAKANDIWVLADEIYQRLTYFTDVAPSIAAVTPRFENWLIVNGVAKTYSMTGWRVGWMVGPADVIEAANSHQSHATGNVDNVAQHAALAALTRPSGHCRGDAPVVRQPTKAHVHRWSATIPGVRCVEPRAPSTCFPMWSTPLGGRWGSTDELARSSSRKPGWPWFPGSRSAHPGISGSPMPPARTRSSGAWSGSGPPGRMTGPSEPGLHSPANGGRDDSSGNDARGAPSLLDDRTARQACGSRGGWLAVEATGISGADVQVWKGEARDVVYPLVPGHEVVGRIATGGPTIPYPVGTRVVRSSPGSGAGSATVAS